MADAVLVLNAGSSSIKFAAFEVGAAEPAPLVKGQVEGLHTSPRFIARDARGDTVSEKRWGAGTRLAHDQALEHLVQFLRGYRGTHELVAVGHRVTHGGVKYTGPVRIDATVLGELDELSPLSPLHQPHNLTPVRLLQKQRPDLPQIACFDTAFHTTAPEVAQMFALPQELTDAGVRRYGFHGLSYEYIATVLPRIDSRAASGKTVVCHLGNGSSMCAMAGGRSVASTMGFTAVEGLPMGTRCGALDPGVVLFLIEQKGMEARAVRELLYNKSGLLGVSGVSSDMRALLTSDDPRAKLAIDIYVYRIGRELGSLAAALGGVDAIVFTAGIGENAALVRERVCRDAVWLGVESDVAANAKGGPRISAAGSRTSAWVIPTNEELMIARHTLRVLGVR
ncbi:MAG TPA: acetate/propionate family kinase [Burkholderiales bacterium]|nr:acetate/propionate family kinase [Burkholderiales bacterium]